jgi:hypothetical protein
MSTWHDPVSPGAHFRIRPTGKEHMAGDIDCAGCGMVNGIRYPHPHREGPTIKHLEFLVHGEAFQEAFDEYCEGGCFVPPIPFAPKPPEGSGSTAAESRHVSDHDLERY